MRVRMAVVMVLACSAVAALAGERVFPLMQSWAEGRELPRAYGVGVTAHWQDQPYVLKELMAHVPGRDVDLSQASGIEIDNELLEINLKLDLWVLPFLNVFGLLGSIDGETIVDIGFIDNIGPISIDYDGVVFGAGVTVAGGWRRCFGSLTAVYTDTALDATDSTVRAWILSPKVGVANGRGAMWLGAMYQEAEEEHAGHIVIPGLSPDPVRYAVGLEQKEEWNYLAGMAARICGQWGLEIEAGVGSRSQVSLSTSYRF